MVDAVVVMLLMIMAMNCQNATSSDNLSISHPNHIFPANNTLIALAKRNDDTNAQARMHAFIVDNAKVPRWRPPPPPPLLLLPWTFPPMDII